MSLVTLRKFLLLLLLTLPGLSIAAQDWRTPDPDNTVYMMTDEGLIIIELAPFMAGKNVQRFKDLIGEGFYDGLDFYRVIDGFVAQAGDLNDKKKSKYKTPVTGEFSRDMTDGSSFILTQSPAFKAEQTGYLHGFSAGRSLADKQEWLLHCPGHVAMARANEANSGSTEFYIVIGQAPRHLDRNMSSLGRVIYGLSSAQALKRAAHNNSSGVIEEEASRSKIKWVKLQSQLSAEKHIQVQIQNDSSQAVRDRLTSAKKLDAPFYHYKGNSKLDMCYYQLRTRIVE